jgi:hypothetical protein
MAIRFAAASALALAAALTVAAPARAQGFFSFYEMSPRQIADMLDDDGYQIRGPMIRRGDIYVVNAVSISGRPTRLIVDARDGHILDRYAERPDSRSRDDDARGLRPPRNIGDDDEASAPRGQQQALGDLFSPPSRVYGNDSLSLTQPDAAPPAPDVKPKHHVAKKHKDSALAKAPATPPSPDASSTPKPDGSSVAAVAPGAPDPEGKKPAAEPSPAPKAVASPEPAPVEKKAETEKPKPAPSPKPEPARKKLNDLPVGTLD